MEDSKRNTFFPSETWSNRRCLVVLIAIVVLMRFWQIYTTEVPARDCVGYIKIAWTIQHTDWQTGIRSAHQHPGYPLTILAMSKIVGLVYDSNLALRMQYSAQLVSALASVLLVVATFWLGREVWDKAISFWGALSYQIWPTIGRLMGDGLSEPVFLLFAATALLFSARALRTGQYRYYALTGLAGSCAYLTRPEGLLIVGLTGMILLLQQAPPLWRKPWLGCLGRGLVLTGATLVLALPFVLIVGHITTKPTPQRLLEGEKTAWLDATPKSALVAHVPLAVWWDGPIDATASDRALWGIEALAETLVRGFFHICWVPALLGLWWYRKRFHEHPGLWVQSLLVLILLLLVYRVATQLGYVSSRHLVLIVLCGVFWTIAGTFVLGAKLAEWCVARWPTLEGTAWADGSRWTVTMMLIVAVFAVVKTLKPLHGDREGFRDAGAWLAMHSRPCDAIFDPYSWSSFYAGRFSDGEPLETSSSASKPPILYVVYEKGKSEHPRLHSIRLAQQLIQRGRLQRSWDVERGQVQIYAVPLH